MKEDESSQRNYFDIPKANITQTGKFREFVNFMRVSPAHQLFTAIHITSVVFPGIAAAEKISEAQYFPAAGLAITTLFNLGLAIYNESLARVKLYEYTQLKEALQKHGWDDRIIEPKSNSWCQRHAARMAAIDTGFENEIDSYYAKGGYRWYDFIPYSKSRKSKK